MKKLMFCVGVACLACALAVQADEATILQVHRTQGGSLSADLREHVRLEFAGDSLVLNVGARPQRIVPFDNVQRLTFEQAQVNAVEHTEVNGCRVVLSGEILHITSQETIRAVQVWNIQGQRMYALPYQDNGMRLEVATQSWHAGVYIVGVETATGIASYKILIQ